jgi:hypothetical protein
MITKRRTYLQIVRRNTRKNWGVETRGSILPCVEPHTKTQTRYLSLYNSADTPPSCAIRFAPRGRNTWERLFIPLKSKAGRHTKDVQLVDPDVMTRETSWNTKPLWVLFLFLSYSRAVEYIHGPSSVSGIGYTNCSRSVSINRLVVRFRSAHGLMKTAAIHIPNRQDSEITCDLLLVCSFTLQEKLNKEMYRFFLGFFFVLLTVHRSISV